MKPIIYLTEREVSKKTSLSLSKNRSDRHLCTGIPYYKIGKAVRYTPEDIWEYMNERKICTYKKNIKGCKIQEMN